MARSKKRDRRRRRSRIFAFLLLAAAAGFYWFVWPFWVLSGQFGSSPLRQPSRLYAQAPELHPGDAWDQERLIRELEATGYSVAAGPIDLVPGTYRAAESYVEIYQRTFSGPAGLAGGARLRASFRGGRIAALHQEEREVRWAVLEPRLVASYYGADLRERRPVVLDELPEDLILAVLAIEDARFLEHRGVSLRGILRAAWTNFRTGVTHGGSTLTQQLVKNIYLNPEKRLIRKIREAVLAMMLEARYPKRDILQAYLNEIYWGRSGSLQLMGVGAAAWAYFDKSPAQLTLAESALLAGMIQSPVRYSPLQHPETARERRNLVLGRLAQLRWIEADRLNAASQEEIETPQGRVARSAPYFADAVVSEARDRFGVEELRDTGLVLHSTLDPEFQAKAEEAVARGVEDLEAGWEKDSKTAGALQAALVSIDPEDGGVRAWVGGRDYSLSQFDRVTNARRQAGSAFKPIVYAAAFADGVAHPGSVYDDTAISVVLDGKRWSPKNSDGQYRGPVTVRTALEKSLNIPTARVALDVGLPRIVETAYALGVSSRLNPYPALALGAMEVSPLELATVYASLAAGGKRPPVHRLVSVWNREGEKVEGTPLPAPQPALDSAAAFLTTQVLQGVFETGTARAAREQGLSDPLAGKTGTTNSRRDSWFAGYARQIATLVWVGYDDNSRTRLSGARAALPIWTRFMIDARPAEGWSAPSRPDGVVRVRIDPETGELATSRCPVTRSEWVLRKNPPQTFCREHEKRRRFRW